MRLYIVYQTLNILFSVVINYVKKNHIFFSNGGSFDHLDLQLLDDYKFFFFVLQL